MILERVDIKDKKDYSKAHLLVSNNWWEGFYFSAGVTRDVVTFKCVLYALSELTRDGYVPYQTEIWDYIREHEEELIEKIVKRIKSDCALSNESPQTIAKRIEKGRRYVKKIHLARFTFILRMCGWTNITTIKTKKLGQGYCKNHHLTDTGKEIMDLIRMGYLV